MMGQNEHSELTKLAHVCRKGVDVTIGPTSANSAYYVYMTLQIQNSRKP